jgi:UPF0755 protein
MDREHIFPEILGENEIRRTKMIRKISAGIVALLFLLGYFFLLSAPRSFHANTLATIPEGKVLAGISHSLKEQGVIRSEIAFEFFVILHGGEKKIIPGDYFFESSLPVYGVASKIIAHEYGLPQIRITIPEGMTRQEMAENFARVLPKFNTAVFLNATEKEEGYLFPDTYFFFSTATTESVLQKLRDTFNDKTATLRTEVKDAKRDFKQIVILASIVEKEAAGDKDRGIIAGILQNRINKGMRLQADATVGYIISKGREEIKPNDLKINSPYNTYLYKGLPPGPISNPGIESLMAAFAPTKSDYLYYIHDKNGVAHYAKTFEEHRKNIEKYLK